MRSGALFEDQSTSSVCTKFECDVHKEVMALQYNGEIPSSSPVTEYFDSWVGKPTDRPRLRVDVAQQTQ